MTVKEQCLKIIDDKITLLYECEPSDDRSIALHWLYEVYHSINTKVEEPAAAPNTIHFSDGSWATPVPEPCKSCPTHPSNGGSGMCNCTLGMPEITC